MLDQLYLMEKLGEYKQADMRQRRCYMDAERCNGIMDGVNPGKKSKLYTLTAKVIPFLSASFPYDKGERKADEP